MSQVEKPYFTIDVQFMMRMERAAVLTASSVGDSEMRTASWVRGRSKGDMTTSKLKDGRRREEIVLRTSVRENLK
jgi:hypothetical protein